MKLQELLKQATPLPWRINPDSKQPPDILAPDGWTIVGMDDCESADVDARLIVHAINMLPKLMEALEDAREFILDKDPDDEFSLRKSRRLSEVIEEADNPPTP